MHRVASHVAAFLVGVVLASAAGAMAHPAKETTIATRLHRLEARYKGLCDTLKYTPHSDIQDLQVRGMFIRLATIC